MSRQRTIAYLVKAWPRLSETFILNEIVSLERRGVPIGIFSTKEPDTGLAPSEIAQVRAEVTYLALRQHWKQAAVANLRGLGRQPRRYLHVLFEVTERAIRQRRFAALKHFFKAAYLADILRYKPADHLHAHFASAPTMVAMFTHQLCGIPYSFTAHAKDIYVAPPAVCKLERARAVVTCTQYNRRFLMDQFGPLCDGKVHCIYHGLDTSRFRFRLSGKADSGEPLILSVARLVEKKGLADLITAAAMLRDRGRSFRLEIVGDGPLRHTLEVQVERLGLGDRVALPGAHCLGHQGLGCAQQTHGETQQGEGHGASQADPRTMGLQYLEALKALGASEATKFVIPVELTGLLAGIAAQAGQAFRDGRSPSA